MKFQGVLRNHAASLTQTLCDPFRSPDSLRWARDIVRQLHGQAASSLQQVLVGEPREGLRQMFAAIGAEERSLRSCRSQVFRHFFDR